jgi:TPR repeat protein
MIIFFKALKRYFLLLMLSMALFLNCTYAEQLPSHISKTYIKNNIPQIKHLANQGNKVAQAITGTLYLKGMFGFSHNTQKAIYWLNLSAKQGDQRANGTLGFMYYLGLGVPKNIAKAKGYFLKSEGAHYSDIQVILGDIYSQDGGAENYKKAKYWYMQALKNGNLSAQGSLGYYYLTIAPKNYPKAIYWLTKSAGRGNKLAQYSLGKLYLKGLGHKKDFKKAKYYLTLSAKQNYVPAQDLLGSLLLGFYGYGHFNYQDAYYWLNKAANQNNLDAQARLALMYAHGWGVMKSPQKVKELMRRVTNDSNLTLPEKWYSNKILSGGTLK